MYLVKVSGSYDPRSIVSIKTQISFSNRDGGLMKSLQKVGRTNL